MGYFSHIWQSIYENNGMTIHSQILAILNKIVFTLANLAKIIAK